MKSRFTVLLLLSVTSLFNNDLLAQEDLTIYLFRHAETTGEGRNPDLSEQGQKRAQSLLTIINEDEVDKLYSTPLNRTMQTIKPFAEHFDIEVENYDHRDLEGFANELKKMSGIILVSGHSNTTPALAHFLTGLEIAPINESEYDNLFIIQFIDGKYTLSVLNYPPFYQTK